MRCNFLKVFKRDKKNPRWLPNSVNRRDLTRVTCSATGVEQADDRKQCLHLAEEAGLDVARITKLVVENIRSADTAELTMEVQILPQTATTEVCW